MLLDEDFTTVDADLIFARVKGRGARKIDFQTFRRALGEVAKKWESMTQEQVEDVICLASAPHYETTARRRTRNMRNGRCRELHGSERAFDPILQAWQVLRHALGNRAVGWKKK
ncbi:Tubulin polymerization-promoting protein family member 3 (TPPP/p20) [Durusdinium trenchii]